MRIIVACLLVLLGDQPALAQLEDPAMALKSRLDAAALQIDSDPQGALEVFDHLAVDSIELRKVRSLTGPERDVHGRLFLLRGRVQLQLLDNEKALESFQELLRVLPQFSGDLSPLEQQLVDQVRQQQGGVLEVTSAVAGAAVLINGMAAGVTGDVPVRTPLVAGTYEVRLEKAGFKPAVGDATVTAGQTTTVGDMAPVQNVPPLLFLSDRDGVGVVLDNVDLGPMVPLSVLRTRVSPSESAAIDRFVLAASLDPERTAGTLIRQPAVDRPMTVRFHRDCFVGETRTIQATPDMLDAGESAQAVAWLGDESVLRLKPDVGSLRIVSTPADADVFLDDQLVGRTPFERAVCVGAHRIRVRHRIGSYNLAATIARGRTEAIDVTIKPDIAFLGAVDSDGRPSPALTASVDGALARGLGTLHLASRQALPPEVTPWTDRSTASLVSAVGRDDRDAIARLLAQAAANFEAPVLLCAALRPGGTAFDVLVFWIDHPGVDRLSIEGLTDADLARVVERIDAPRDVGDVIEGNDLGMRVADTGLANASLLVITVRPGSPAAVAGVRPGDAIAAVEGTPSTAAQLAARVSALKPGDFIAVRVTGPEATTRDMSVAVQRVPRRAPGFSARIAGNTLVAKLTARSLTATTPAERGLVAFNLAVTYMRFGEWRRALAGLLALSDVPGGDGVGTGMAKFLAARCHEELGEREAAAALYASAAAVEDQTASDDGTPVAALARYRLAMLAGSR